MVSELEQAAHDGPRVYLAGPEVFLPDALLQAGRKKAICTRHGLTGVFPLDTKLSSAQRSPRDLGLLISQANEALIRGCVALIANLTPFRGISADVGTAYEMGLAHGLGLQIYAYSNVTSLYLERAQAALGDHLRTDSQGRLRDATDMEIENFHLHDNLMLEGAIQASAGSFVVHEAAMDARFHDLTAFEQCVQQLRMRLKYQGSV